MACLLALGGTIGRAESTALKWGRPSAQRPTTIHRAAPEVQVRPAQIVRDPSVVAAAWEEDDRFVASSPETTQATDNHSVVVKRSADPSPRASERLAQRDPFEQPVDRLLSELEIEDPQIEETEKAIKDEFERRRAEQDANGQDHVEQPQQENDAAPATEDSELFEKETAELFGEETPEPLGEKTTEVQSEQILDDPFDEPMPQQLYEPKETETPSEEPEELLEEESDQRQDERNLFGEPSLDEDSQEPSDVSELFDEEMKHSDSDEESTSSLDIEPILEDEDTIADEPEELEQDEARNQNEESEKNCEEELTRLRADRIDDIDLSIRVEGSAGEDFPFECKLDSNLIEPRQWPQITYNWKAAGLCHKPLYFEQVHLERYGHSWGHCIQPIMSGVHFFGTLPVLPYKMGLRTPTECVYTLGYYRPGSCAPYMIDAVPFTWRAILFEAGAATGMSFIFP